MKSFQPMILAAMAAATFLFAHDAAAAEARRDPSVAATTEAQPADTPVLIAAAGRPAGIEEAVAPAVGWDPGKRGAREAALHGPDALRRFVERTRTIYALQYRDFAPLDR